MVRPGYKPTEFGALPVEWTLFELAEMDPFVTSGSRGWAKYYSDQGSAFLRITNLSRQSIYPDLSDLKYVRIPPTDTEGRRTQLLEGDLLVSITADIGIVGYVDRSIPSPTYINQHIALVRFDPGRISSKFLCYFLASKGPQRLFRATTDQGAKAGMSLTGVRKIKAVLPPLPEQNSIAAALSEVDALIESLDQLIAKKRQIRQGAMQDLLTGARRLPGVATTKDRRHSEVGMIPKDWRVIPLGRLILFIEYGSSAKSNQTGQIPVLRMGNLQNGQIDWSNLVFTDDGLEIRKYTLSSGDVLFNRTNTIDLVGKTAVYNGKRPAIFAGYLIRIRVDRAHLDPQFLNYVLNAEFSKKYSAKILSVAVGQANINGEKLKTYPIPLPPTKAEQEAIVSILSGLEDEIAAMEFRLAKYRQLKQGMMQDLLTGRIRLV